jgi:hypothetical protein
MDRQFGIQGSQFNNDYTAEQNEQFTAQFQAIMLELRESFLAGNSVDSDVVQTTIAKHYEFVLQFWKPSRDGYKSLALSYILPTPYRDSIEAVEPGLAKFNHDAIVVWANANLD